MMLMLTSNLIADDDDVNLLENKIYIFLGRNRYITINCCNVDGSVMEVLKI